jgi:catechol 2,3-dioxygenase-like lactoylglutathione lyase family enzyme
MEREVEPSEFKLSAIHTVMLGVRDLERSVAFYRDRLGLPVKFQSAEFAFFEAGGVTLALSRPLARVVAGADSDSSLSGAAEVVFAVPGVREAHAALRAKGVEFTHEPRNVAGTAWAANFDDPDGHALSIFGPERA